MSDEDEFSPEMQEVMDGIEPKINALGLDLDKMMNMSMDEQIDYISETTGLSRDAVRGWIRRGLEKAKAMGIFDGHIDEMTEEISSLIKSKTSDS